MEYVPKRNIADDSGFMSYIPTIGTLGDARDALLLRLECNGDKAKIIKSHKGQSSQAFKCAAHEMTTRETYNGASENDQRIALDQLQTSFDAGMTLCESPIERTLLPALLIAQWVGCECFPAKVSSASLEDIEGLMEPSRALIVPQLKVAGRRLDFALFLPIELAPKGFAIECDGRAYHNAMDDIERDVELAQSGFATLRFTGSQINTNPFECALNAVHQVEQFRGGRN
jgi:hypothetical protein